MDYTRHNRRDEPDDLGGDKGDDQDVDQVSGLGRLVDRSDDRARIALGHAFAIGDRFLVIETVVIWMLTGRPFDMRCACTKTSHP